MDDTKVLAIAACQHGLLTQRQARQAGLSRGAVRRRVVSGRLIEVGHGVYRVAGSAETPYSEIAAAVLGARQPAFASHATAALLWGIAVDSAGIELTTLNPTRVRRNGILEHRSYALVDVDVSEKDGIAVTSPARTLIDLSGRYNAERLGNLVDDALRKRIVSISSIHRCAERLRSAPGRRMSIVRDVLATRVPGYDPGESDLEARALRAILRAGLPAPRQQYEVLVGGIRMRLDFAYPEQRLAVEMDGWTYHGPRSNFEADRRRDNALLLAGWQVLRFTTSSSDEDIVRSVRAALDAFARNRAV